MIDDALREELSALLDGALPEGRASDLRRRIAAEPELAREYEELRRAVAAVRALPRARAPGELRARVRDSIAAPRARSRIFRLGALAAAAIVVLAAGIAFQLRGEPPAKFEARKDTPGAPLPGDVLRDQSPPSEGARAPSSENSKLEAKADFEKQQVGASKDGAKRGAPAKVAAEDLLRAVVRSREIAPSDRKAYLRRVSALGAEKAFEHIRGVFPEGALGQEAARRDGAVPVLATVQLEDRDEAILVRAILDALPRPEAKAAGLAIEQEEKDQMTTEVFAKPDDLDRLARWLGLLDLGRKDVARPRVEVFGESKPAEEAAPKARTAVVKLKYGKPPEPKPEAPAKGK